MMYGFRSMGGLQRFISVFQLSGTCSFRLVRTGLPSPRTFTGYRSWQNGKPQPVCELKISNIGTIAVPSG
jgi:hypothetical protein